MDYSTRLTRAFEGTRFSGVPNWDDAYPLVELGKLNIREFEALGDERRTLILGLLSEILAAIIQPKAIEEFGCTDRSAIKSIVDDGIHFRLRMEKLGLGEQMLKEYTDLGIPEETARSLQESFTSYYAVEFIRLITDLVDRWRLFHVAQNESMAKVLADMMKEVGA